MAKLKDILDAESQRSSLEQCRVIHLFTEGTFLRAYEWSAWLCVRYVQSFKATKRKFKNEDASVVFVGFHDRVVHHLYYNYTYRMYERTFIHDSYSCLAGRGTHYGIRRSMMTAERHFAGFGVFTDEYRRCDVMSMCA